MAIRFLLTNDDGIYARGLLALYQELSKDAECLIVAPEIEQSAVGHAITIARPLMVRKARKNGNFLGYAVAGTPADCVKIGICELAGGPVDLVVSGINRGANVGINVLYSGTVSAATEAAIQGVPSLAISLDTHEEADYLGGRPFRPEDGRLHPGKPPAACRAERECPGGSGRGDPGRRGGETGAGAPDGELRQAGRSAGEHLLLAGRRDRAPRPRGEEIRTPAP